MDGFRVHVRGDKQEQFDAAVRLAFAGRRQLTHWLVKDEWLYLYWHGSEGATPLPSPMKADHAIPFVWGWLEGQEPADRRPDIDGTVSPRGFEVETTDEGMWSYAFARVRKIWALYGK